MSAAKPASEPVHFLGSKRDGEQAVADLRAGKRAHITLGQRPRWMPLLRWSNARWRPGGNAPSGTSNPAAVRTWEKPPTWEVPDA